jgi:hypothetical protein
MVTEEEFFVGEAMGADGSVLVFVLGAGAAVVSVVGFLVAVEEVESVDELAGVSNSGGGTFGVACTLVNILACLQ